LFGRRKRSASGIKLVVKMIIVIASKLDSLYTAKAPGLIPKSWEEFGRD